MSGRSQVELVVRAVRPVITKHPLFDVYVDGDFLIRSRQPLFDGARALIERGLDMATPVTMRHEGAAHASFAPAPVGVLARLTVADRDRGMRFEAWAPFGGRDD